jgi:hypothetical protein
MHSMRSAEDVSATIKDDATMADEMIKRSEFLEYMQAFEERSDSRFGRLGQSMKVQFEETRSLIRLSLEGLDALRETTTRGFNDWRTENQENQTLLEAALTHVRRRVEHTETTRPARRRS